MDKLSDSEKERIAKLILSNAVAIFRNDVKEFMIRYEEVLGLYISFYDIKEPKNHNLQIHDN